MEQGPKQTILYYEQNQLKPEHNPAKHLLAFLYYSTVGSLVRFVIRQHWVSKLLGIFYDSRLSTRHISPFMKKYKIVMDDYEIPQEGFRSFNDFFIRTLKPGTRRIEQDEAKIISPADGKVLVIPTLTPGTVFPVKNAIFNLAQFVGSQELAKQYDQGTLIIIRLAPENYHWFHFPTDARASKPVRIKGELESVNPLAFNAKRNPLITNERHLITLATPKHDTILMIPVGAMFVGKIVETYAPDQWYKKGDKAGYFAFGGSTVALVFKAGIIRPKEDFILHSLQGYETSIKMGVNLNE